MSRSTSEELSINDNLDDEIEIISDKTEKKTTELYFDEQEKYSNIYGKKTIVFFEMGKFYEAYSTSNKGYKHLDKLEDLLGITLIKREENDKINNAYNKPSQFGIPLVSIKKKLDILVENDYVVVLFNQNNKNGKITRFCSGVYSKGTHMSNRQYDDSKNIMSVFISEEQQLSGKNLMAIGVTILDVTTGKSIVHEFSSNQDDEKFGLDELIRMIQTFKPLELVIYFCPDVYNDFVVKNLKNYLEVEKYNNVHFYIYSNKKGNDKLNLISEDCFKISYQNALLSNIFELNNQIHLNKSTSPLEVLGMEKIPYVVLSLIIILNFIKEHDLLLLKNLPYPEIYIYNKHLILGNDAISELNIVDSNGLELYNKKFKSVFDVINHTSTPMGRRLLRNNLLNPMSQQNRKNITNKYNYIEELINSEIYPTIKNELKNFCDVERLHRKIALETITPYEFYKLDLSYKSTMTIISIVNKNKVLKKLISKNTYDKFTEYQTKYNGDFILDDMKLHNKFTDINKSFFKKGVYKDLDLIQEKIDYAQLMVSTVKNYFTGLLSKNMKSAKIDDIIKQEYNEKDGYYFTITKTNEQILKGKISQKKNSQLVLELGTGKNFKIKTNEIKFVPLKKGRTKIFVEPLEIHVENLDSNIELLSKMIKNKFSLSLKSYFNNYRNTMTEIVRFISEIDFLVSGASVAKEYYYCKPQIISDVNIPSYIKAKKLRHPIIERICKETEYVPNDIELGNIIDNNKKESTKNGIILYGLNSSGKSSLMRSIGIAVILAQIGYYVPADEFVYEPYMAIYARINANDNFYKGLSCFALEMTELNAIIARTENQGINTLVIGDELCKGTEKLSELVLVAQTVETMSEYKTSFIISSHIHKLFKLDEIKVLKNVRVYHLRVEYNEEKDCLIFDRKLTLGAGPEYYGLIVAKYYIKNTKFMVRAEKIRKRLMGKSDVFDIPVKKSHYNQNILLKWCQICKYRPTKDYHKELDTHHINFQKNCLSDGKIKEKQYLHKNQESNLVTLCKKCHCRTHSGIITINGYDDSSIGPLLNYKIDHMKLLEESLKTLEQINADNRNKTRNKTHTKTHNKVCSINC